MHIIDVIILIIIFISDLTYLELNSIPSWSPPASTFAPSATATRKTSRLDAAAWTTIKMCAARIATRNRLILTIPSRTTLFLLIFLISPLRITEASTPRRNGRKIWLRRSWKKAAVKIRRMPKNRLLTGPNIILTSILWESTSVWLVNVR